MAKSYKVKEVNYFGLKHEEVCKKFEGDLTYIGDMCLNSGKPVAVYRAKNPNTSKGHKEFMLLQVWDRQGIIAGMTREELKKHSKHQAMLCRACNTVLYSLQHHHYHTCGCENDTFVDGGKSYFRAGAMDLSKTVSGTYDILTKKFSKSRTKKVLE